MTIILELETVDWQLQVTGRLPILPPFITDSGISAIHVSGDTRLRAYSRSAKGLVPIVSGELVEPLFYEHIRYDFYLRTNVEGVRLELPPVAELRHRVEAITHYSLNFRDDVGYAEARVRSPAGEISLRFEVFPRKIDYRRDYIRMRDEVAAITRNLVMTIQARTFALAIPEPTRRPTLTEWFSLLQFYFDEMLRAGRAIADNPHSQLVKETRKTQPDRARRLNARELARALRRQPTRTGGVLPNTSLHLPTRIPEVNQRVTFDTLENRYFKALLVETQRKLHQITKINITGDEDADLTAEQKYFLAARPIAEEMAQKIRKLLNAPFLRQVTTVAPVRPNSMVFLRHPHYAAFAKWARVVNGGLVVGGGLLQIGVKNIALLYEYWCFLKLVETLRERLELEQQTLVQVKHLKVTVVLQKGRESAVEFHDPVTGKAFFLVYNRLFSRLPTLNQRPDNVIQLADEESFFIFDAKYRLSFDTSYQARYGGIGPKTDDINAMHRYRDAIVIPHPLKSGHFRMRVVIGAVVLFPYSDEDVYTSHQFYKSINSVQIGGLPFLPEATVLVTNQLLALLHENGFSD